MDLPANYRFVRSLGHGATLHAVTFDGIEDFLSTTDAGDPGLVALLYGEAGQEQGGFSGGRVVGHVLRAMEAQPDGVKDAARPLAVVTLASREVPADTALHLANRLMARLVDARGRETVPADVAERFSRGVPEDLGRFEPLVDGIAQAVVHVLGTDPFKRSRTLN